MTYESAPATKLLATYCAACSRPLLDSVSVEIGMGPDCRQRYFRVVPGENAANRTAANKLVFQIASTRIQGVDTLAAIEGIRLLGFHQLADKLTKRVARVTITIVGSRIILKAPYTFKSVPILAHVSGRIWDRAIKANTYPLTSKAALWVQLKLAFPGALAHGPSGFFTIGNGAKVMAVSGALATEAPVLVPAPKPVTVSAAPRRLDSLVAMLKASAERARENAAEVKADCEQTEREDVAKHVAKTEMEMVQPVQLPLSIEAARLRFSETLKMA